MAVSPDNHRALEAALKCRENFLPYRVFQVLRAQAKELYPWVNIQHLMDRTGADRKALIAILNRLIRDGAIVCSKATDDRRSYKALLKTLTRTRFRA